MEYSYIGEYKFRDMLIPDAIPPIVSEELFNRVQEIMTRDQKAPAMRKAEDDYILTTRLVLRQMRHVHGRREWQEPYRNRSSLL